MRKIFHCYKCINNSTAYAHCSLMRLGNRHGNAQSRFSADAVR